MTGIEPRHQIHYDEGFEDAQEHRARRTGREDYGTDAERSAYDAGYDSGLEDLREFIDEYRTGPEPAASREATMRHLRERIDFETERLGRLAIEWWRGPCPPYSLDPRAIAWRSEERKRNALVRAYEVLSAST